MSVFPSSLFATQKITIQLRWYHNFIFAGYYAAVEKGFYDEAGLDVSFIQGSATISSVDQVLAGKAQFGTANSRILIDRFSGKPVVALATIFQHSPLVLLTQKNSGINSLHDLVGKQVFFDKKRDVEIAASFINEGIPLNKLQFIDRKYSIDNYFDPAIKGIAAFITNQPYFLMEQNLPFNIIYPSTYGIDFYGHCLFTTQQEIKEHPKRVKAFLKASLRGWEYALREPEEIIDLLLTKYRVKDSRAHIRYSADKVKELVQPELVAIGHMNPGRWKHMADIFAKLKLIDQGYSLEGFIYNPYPIKDYAWLFRVLVIAIAISVFLGVVTLFLFRFNTKLKSEVLERKRMEERLRQSEDKFRTIFKTSPNVITLSSVKDGIYVEVNDAFTKLVGYSKKEVIGKSIFRLNIWNDLKQRDRLVGWLQKKGLVENFEAEFKAKSGRIINGLMSARILDIENKKYLLSVTQDITEKKTADHAMRLIQYGVDRASDCIFWMNSKACLIYVNNATCKLLGYSYDELVSMNLNQVDPQISLAAWPDRLANLKKIKSARFESQHQTKAGRLIPVEVTSSYVSFEGEEGIFSFARDITERQQAEQEKIEAQKIITDHKKLALVGQVAGKMAHDFNNILGIIMGNTELSLLKCKDEQIKKILELIFKQTLRGKNLTKNLVAFAKDQEPKQKFFNINEKISLVLNLMTKDLMGIELFKEESAGIPDLLADPGMIEHALVNLIQNSIHATSMVRQAKITIRTFYKNQNIYIEIKDNGCGIPEEVLDRIYEPAFTMKGSMDVTGSYKSDIKGTGYGMANVKKYIEQHKGSITINSKVGNGTKITITLPVIKKKLTEKEKIEIQKENFYFEQYILLVEDEQAISDVQYEILTHEPFNHKVDIAANGQIAVDLFEKNKYDFISLDYVLPGKFNGMDVYKHIRQTNETLPILFVSGNLDFLESIKQLKNSDPYIDHLSKPCQNKDYVNAINELLEKILA